MQCATLLKKRSLEAELEPWSCRAKRVCLEMDLHPAECPMEISQTFPLTSQQQELQMNVIQPRASPLCCPRCLGGEPGHINHILGH